MSARPPRVVLYLSIALILAAAIFPFWWMVDTSLMIPGILLVIPLYITFAKWGLLNTRLGLILIYTGLTTSFVIWNMQSFLAEIPRDIEEAAMVAAGVIGALPIVIFALVVQRHFVRGLTLGAVK